MFDKILIANRGEIACRVIETAHLLGVDCVAVYSDADAGARHVEMADEAVHIGGPAPVDSYLRGDVIIAAALETGAQAIHPGYGFLSENPGFVEKVEAAGLVFIGPSADAIRAMGMKDAAKMLMERAAVPVVPGYHGAEQDGEHLAREAAKIGYPVLIKAVAGGGGKGMRLVERAEDFPDALRAAGSEARGAFGHDAVLVEKFIERPRHIEVQIFGDGQNVVHLYERDCSLQRRHQKVIEEAPAPGMTRAMRTAMCEAAVRAASAIGYKGAGTVEFIVDASDGLRADRFWFMEMNTRLQVEHPVTEAVTGVDLVEWQLRVASGERLPMRQDELHLSGHAFEARLYAEDTENSFLPVTGTLAHLQFPAMARADTGVRAGDAISPYYDPMIAKITVHGSTRDIALLRLDSALTATEVAGTITNLTFLGNLARHADFRRAHIDTGLIARDLHRLTAVEPPSAQAIALAVVMASGIDAGYGWDRGFTLWAPVQRSVRLRWRDQEIDAGLTVFGPENVSVTLEERAYRMHRANGHWATADRSPRLRAFRGGDSVTVFSRTTWQLDIPDALAVSADAGQAGDLVLAPMPGLVKSVHVQPGQQVQRGDCLVILEAMKMEHTLAAPRDGTVDELLCAADQQVAAGAALISLIEVAE
jgi:3-methylcrotonyl-CoA carboxylase alpha subunit